MNPKEQRLSRKNLDRTKQVLEKCMLEVNRQLKNDLPRLSADGKSNSTPRSASLEVGNDQSVFYLDLGKASIDIKVHPVTGKLEEVAIDMSPFKYYNSSPPEDHEELPWLVDPIGSSRSFSSGFDIP